MEKVLLYHAELQRFRLSMLNHRKLSIRPYRTKKVLSIKSWTARSSVFDYIEPKGFCPLMLNHTKFFVELYSNVKVLFYNAELDKVLSVNFDLQMVAYSVILNWKGSVQECWTAWNFRLNYMKPKRFYSIWVTSSVDPADPLSSLTVRTTTH